MTIDPSKVSFSVAQGYESLPQPLQLEELNPRARIQFWNVFYETFINPEEDEEIDEDELSDLSFSIHMDFFERAIDEAPSYWNYLGTIYQSNESA
ncbi:MAG: hypothetical protein F4Y63_09830 [Chloroflexi bacterium]|nr:hypothetical protein [Chloroflexota bacterium]MYK62162.1 hypothetical protein [Chloroflexota bacterium]